MNIIDKIDMYLNENKVKDAIQKFGMKMKGSTQQTAEDWVDGMGEMSKKEKNAILKGIQQWIDKN